MPKLKCCICGLGDNSTYKKVDNYYLMRCKNCGLIYLDQTYSEQYDFIDDAKKDIKNEDKEKVEYWSFPQLYYKHKKVFIKYFKERLKRIRKYHPNPKTILDVGCGYGFWMDYCRRKGIICEGIDISKESIDYIQNTFHLNAWRQNLMEFDTDKKYDAILMFDVIEHLENPNKGLSKCKNLLKEGGLLYLQVPNLIGFKIPLNHGYGLPYHFCNIKWIPFRFLANVVSSKVFDFQKKLVLNNTLSLVFKYACCCMWLFFCFFLFLFVVVYGFVKGVSC